MNLPFVVRIVLIIIILSGLIAYIGNYVGHRIGKKRLSVFHLRPRHTAIAITIISGMLISLITLGILLFISQDARTALLGLEKLRNEMDQKTKELSVAQRDLEETQRLQSDLEKNLETARTEIAQLLGVKEKLNKEVKTARQGQVLFKVGEVITLSLIQAGPEKEKMAAGLRQILSAADTYIRGLGVKSEKHLVYMIPEDFDQALYSLLNENKIFVVKLIADRNAFWGEEIPAKFEMVENKLVYKSGAEIASADIAKGLSAPEIEQEVMKLLQTLNLSAVASGVMADPTSGVMGNIPYSQINELAKKIKSANKKATLRASAAKDIYVIGPLDVKFKF